jgi:hypothetical protein
MRAREAKAYHCEDCDCVLLYESRDTEFGRRLMLVHDPFPGCKFSGKVFYVPRIDLTEFPADQLGSTFATRSIRKGKLS